jgi:hypothetical protein
MPHRRHPSKQTEPGDPDRRRSGSTRSSASAAVCAPSIAPSATSRWPNSKAA